MKRNVLPRILLMLIAVILVHEGTMAVVGHAANDGIAHHRDHAEHDETSVAEQCGTVRLVFQRLTGPEPPEADATPGLLLAAQPPMFAAISASFLTVPVVPPPSACLARFQVFRI